MQISADIHNILQGGTTVESRKINWNWTYSVDQSGVRELTEDQLNAEAEAGWREIEKVLRQRYEDERNS